jgi:hypothetical protein
MRCLLFPALFLFVVESWVGGQSSQTLVHRMHMVSHLFPLQLSSPSSVQVSLIAAVILKAATQVFNGTADDSQDQGFNVMQ